MMFQEVVLEWATNELTSHAAMLFASMTALFAFLKVINDYNNRMGKKSKIFSLVSLFVLLSLSTLTFYTMDRLIIYGAFVHQTIQSSPKDLELDEGDLRLYYGRISELTRNATNNSKNLGKFYDLNKYPKARNVYCQELKKLRNIA